MSQENVDVKDHSDQDRATTAAESGMNSSGHRGRLWLNWGLALLTAGWRGRDDGGSTGRGDEHRGLQRQGLP